MAAAQKVLRADVDHVFRLVAETLELPAAGGARLNHLLRGVADLTGAALCGFFMGQRLRPKAMSAFAR